MVLRITEFYLPFTQILVTLNIIWNKTDCRRSEASILARQYKRKPAHKWFCIIWLKWAFDLLLPLFFFSLFSFFFLVTFTKFLSHLSVWKHLKILYFVKSSSNYVSNRGVEECKNYNLFISVLIVMRERETISHIFVVCGLFIICLAWFFLMPSLMVLIHFWGDNFQSSGKTVVLFVVVWLSSGGRGDRHLLISYL